MVFDIDARVCVRHTFVLFRLLGVPRAGTDTHSVCMCGGTDKAVIHHLQLHRKQHRVLTKCGASMWSGGSRKNTMPLCPDSIDVPRAPRESAEVIESTVCPLLLIVSSADV